MKRVVLYARVSTEKQAERDLSIPDQLAAMERHCEVSGWEIHGTYVDKGASATTDKRREFQRMVDDALGGHLPIDTIFVHSTSRWFRDSLLDALYRQKLM